MTDADDDSQWHEFDEATYDPWPHRDGTRPDNVPYQAQYAENDGAWDSFTGVATEFDFGQGIRSGTQQVKKEDHDRPPIWDGTHPEKGARTFIRLLRMWLTTTQVPKKWQATLIWQSVRGDLKDIIDRMSNDEILEETAGEKLLATFESIYEEWLTPDLLETLEN